MDAVGVLTVLSRAASHHPAAAGLVEAALRADLVGLAGPAIEVGLRDGRVVGAVLARVLDDAPVSWQDLVRIERAIPFPTVALAVADLVVIRRIVRQWPDDIESADRARWLTSLGVVCAQSGRPADALPRTQEAVDLYRVLADTNPDRHRSDHRSDLASSLNNPWNLSSALGRPADALPPTQEAVDPHRALAQANPTRCFASC